MSTHADVIDPAAFSVSELRAAMFDRQAALSRPLAVLLVAHKAYEAKVDDLTRLLRDETEAPRVRHAAAHVLSLTATPDATAALRSALDTVVDPLALRGVALGLALLGDAAALPGIARLVDRGDAVSPAAAWAAALLRYRLGEVGPGVGKPARRLAADPSRATANVASPAERATLEGALAQLAASAPGFAFADQGALAFTCRGGKSMLLLLDRALVARGPIERMLDGKALVGAIAERSSLEGESWSLASLLLSEPEGPTRVRIAAVTPEGRLVLDGELTANGDRADFEMQSVEAPGAVATDVAGSVVDGQVRLERLLVERTRFRPEVPPRLPARPVGF